MIREAIEFLLSKQANFETYVDGYGKEHIGYDGKHFRITADTISKGFELTTLQGVVDYISENIDAEEHESELTIHIISPSKVKIYTDLNQDLARTEVVSSNAILSGFQMDHWYDSETFMIHLLSNFVNTDDLKKLVQLIGTISVDEGVTTEDDGFTQKVTARKGVHLKGNELLPPRVQLSPIRTFVEVEQPISEFSLRVKEERGIIYGALFQADGGYWRIEAMQNIKNYLQENLESLDIYNKIKILM
ncbi:hypothetical protein QBE53_05985 [Vallitaleaceae bacterium 9-2]